MPNRLGGRENLEAIAFLQEMNTVVHRDIPGVLTVAEESTAWGGVSRPVDAGGLGFSQKWNMGWMHDTLTYFSTEPVHRQWHHDLLTFGLTYAWSENFVLPLSHDEVVHLKGSLLGKMPGDRWQRFANLRALYAWMWSHPGKQLLFMGAELAQEREWSHDREIDWFLLADPLHRGVRDLLRELNRVEAERPALWAADTTPAGSPGSTPTTARRRCTRSCGSARAGWWRVRRQPHARAAPRLPARACPAVGGGSTCSTPTTSGGAAAGSRSPRWAPTARRGRASPTRRC